MGARDAARLLCLSDVHNNVRAAEALCRAEAASRFDAVVVAGDMGSETAAGTLGALVAAFRCRVLYVFGNWDARLPYAPPLAEGARHLHEGAVALGGFAVAGFSGCAANWGRNPFALEARAEGLPRRELDRRVAAQSLARAARQAEEAAPGAPVVLVAHERVFRLAERLPAARLHLFGHVHGFRHTAKGGLHNVNVSSLDRPHLSYAAIELGDREVLSVERRTLPPG